MKTRRLLLWTLLLACIVIGLVFVLPAGHLRSYQGKSIRDWALQLSVDRGPESGAERNAAKAAFAAMGTNALPELLVMLECREGSLKRAVRARMPRWPGWAGRLALKWVGPRPDMVRQAAGHALTLLGPRALPAVPTLRAALTDREGYVRWLAVGALSKIGGPEAVAALLTTLQDTDPLGPQFAAEGLRLAGPEGIPALVQTLENTNTRPLAVWNLTRMGATAAPVLEQLSAQGSAEVRILATNLLERLK